MNDEDVVVSQHPKVSTDHFDFRLMQRYNFMMSDPIKDVFIKMIDECADGVDLLEDWDFPVCVFKIDYCFQSYVVVVNMIEKILITVWRPVDKHPKKKVRKKELRHRIDKDSLRKKDSWLLRHYTNEESNGKDEPSDS